MRQDGSGLVEVMVAAGLLALAVVLSEQLLLGSRRAMFNAQGYQSAQLLGQSLLALAKAGQSDWLHSSFSLQLSRDNHCQQCTVNPHLSRDLSRWLQLLQTQGQNNPLFVHALVCIVDQDGRLQLTLAWPDSPWQTIHDCGEQEHGHRLSWQMSLMG